MSGPSRLRAYRACINLAGYSNGDLLYIDDTDPRWADWIRQGWISPAGPPADYAPPAEPITRPMWPDGPSTEQDYFEYPIGDQE